VIPPDLKEILMQQSINKVKDGHSKRGSNKTTHNETQVLQ